MSPTMIHRFSLYGLLKNQRYFEAFLVLALVERGLSFTEIGILIATKELVAQALEVPSGVMADLLGRRRMMVISFATYVLAYLGLAFAYDGVLLAVGMAGIGGADAFRSGTHKAMIFDWLQQQGREEERVKVYGLTRSWSQIGSAVAAPIGAVVVWRTGSYADVFWLSAIPAAFNLLNLATYPRSLEGPGRIPPAGVTHALQALWAAARQVWPHRGLRRWLAEAAGITGLHRSTKDYLQPLMERIALGGSWIWVSGSNPHPAIVVGVTYMLLFGGSAAASRSSYRIVQWAGELERAAGWIRGAVVTSFLVMLAASLLDLSWLVVLAFIGLSLIQNLFRPVLLGRMSDGTPDVLAATVLSVESQVTSLGAVVMAPLLGWAVDWASSSTALRLWPVPLLGFIVSGLVLWLARLQGPDKQGDRIEPRRSPHQ